MAAVELSEHGRKIMEVTQALGVGHLEAILSKKNEVMALKPDELERMAAILNVTRAAGNGCCTGG